MFAAVPLARGIRDQRADRALRLSFVSLPVQSVLLAGIADDLLRILLRGVAIVSLLEVFLLRIRQRLADTNGRALILADAAEENLLQPGLGVEIPLAGSSSSSTGEGMASSPRRGRASDRR